MTTVNKCLILKSCQIIRQRIVSNLLKKISTLERRSRSKMKLNRKTKEKLKKRRKTHKLESALNVALKQKGGHL